MGSSMEHLAWDWMGQEGFDCSDYWSEMKEMFTIHVRGQNILLQTCTIQVAS